jgi:hypothetical protein
MYFKVLIIIFLNVAISTFIYGQKDWSKIIKENTTPKAFAEVYWGIDALNTNNTLSPDFLYNHKRLKEVGLNSAIIGADFDYRRVRSSFSFIAGNYATYNIIEPLGLRQIYEANFGFKLLKYHELWLDVGVMESNLGFESVISTSNRTLSRGLLAENSPYYLNAAKLSYTTHNEKWHLELLASNGWQRMTSGQPSLGHTLQYHPNEKWTINSSSFIGDVRVQIYYPWSEYPTYTLNERVFHNFYVKRETDKISLILGADFGRDRTLNNTIVNWEAYVAQFSYAFTEKISATIRGEHFSDPSEVISIYPGYSTLDVLGASFNLDLQLHDLIQLRLEARYLRNRETSIGIVPIPDPYANVPMEFLLIGTSLSIDLWNH